MTRHKYMVLISPGPFMIVRVPWVSSGRRRIPLWKDILKGFTGVMRSHGLKLKDLHAAENLSDPAEWDPAIDDFWRKESTRLQAERELEKLESAYRGGSDHYATFWLYDWSVADGGFVVVREPIA